MNETERDISTTSGYSPTKEDYAKWYTELRERLEKKVTLLEGQYSRLETQLVKREKDLSDLIKKNYVADQKIKNLFWWVCFLSPFILIIVLMIGFYIGGGRDKIINAIRNIIISLGILGIIEMIYVGYNTKKHEDKIKKCEDEIRSLENKND